MSSFVTGVGAVGGGGPISPTFGMIACCLCGTSIQPNDVAMCMICIRGQIDITDGIGRNAEIIQCTKCERWFSQKDTWVFHEIESPGLMALCLRKVTGLQKVKILDAFWIWTEPHSKRLKIAIELEKPVMDNKINLRQKVEVEYVIRNKQCLECIREASEHTWGAQIQLRQRNSNSQSLITLESSLTKGGMHHLMLGIEVVKFGMNFFFKNKNQAERVINFISTLLPTRIKSSKKMVSSNKQSNTQKYEYVYLVDVIPLVKHDLVYVTKEHKLTSSSQSELMIVEKLSSSLHLLNPLTSRRIDMTATKYFSLPVPLTAIMNTKQLIPYIVLDIDHHQGTVTPAAAAPPPPLSSPSPSPSVAATHHQHQQTELTRREITIAKESDLGENDITYQTITHLGHLVKAGDVLLGYDVTHSSLFSDADEGTLRLPTEVIIVKKGLTPKIVDDTFNGEMNTPFSGKDQAQDPGDGDGEEGEEDEDEGHVQNLGDILQTAQVESYYERNKVESDGRRREEREEEEAHEENEENEVEGEDARDLEEVSEELKEMATTVVSVSGEEVKER